MEQEAVRFMTFIVRVRQDATGCLSGIVEQVRTGRKARFDGLDAVGPLIGQLASQRPDEPLPDAGLDAADGSAEEA